MKVKVFKNFLITGIFLGVSSISWAIIFIPDDLNIPSSNSPSVPALYSLSSDDQTHPDSEIEADEIDVSQAEIVPKPFDFDYENPGSYFDSDYPLSDWNSYSQEKLKEIALNSEYALTRAMALTQINDIQWLKDYALENGELDNDLTNFEIIAILNNPDLDKETFNKIVTSDKVMNDPELLHLFIGFDDKGDWDAIKQDKEIAEKFMKFLDKKEQEEKSPFQEEVSPNEKRKMIDNMFGALLGYLSSYQGEVNDAFEHSFLLNARARGKLIPQLSNYLLDETKEKDKRINAAIMLDTLGHFPYLGEFVNLGEKKSKDIFLDLIEGLRNEQDKDVRLAIAEDLEAVNNFVSTDVKSAVEVASKLVDFLKDSSLDKEVQAHALLSLRRLVATPFELEDYLHNTNFSIVGFNPEDVKLMEQELKDEVIPFLKDTLTSKEKDPLVRFFAGYAMRRIFSASYRYLGEEKAKLVDELLNMATNSEEDDLARAGAMLGLEGISYTEAKGEIKEVIIQAKEKIVSSLLNIVNNPQEDLYVRMWTASALNTLMGSEISQKSKDKIAQELIKVLKDNDPEDEVLNVTQEPFGEIAGPIVQYYEKGGKKKEFSKRLAKVYLRQSASYALTSAIIESELSSEVLNQAINTMLNVFKDPSEDMDLISYLGMGMSFITRYLFVSPEVKQKFVEGLIDIFENPYDFRNLSEEEQNSARQIMIWAAKVIGNGLNMAGVEDVNLKKRAFSALSDFMFNNEYDPEIRYWAEYPLAVLTGDPKISTSLKKDLAEKLKDYIKANLEDAQESKVVKGAFGILYTAFQDPQIDSNFKLKIFEELNLFGENGIIENPNVDEIVKSASLAMISSLISNPNIPLEKKQSWVKELLEIMKGKKESQSQTQMGMIGINDSGQEEDWFAVPELQKMAGIVLKDIAERDDIRPEVKGSLVTDILKIFNSKGEDIDRELKEIAGDILLSIAQDEDLSIEKKMEIFNGIKDELTEILDKSIEGFSHSFRGFQLASIMEGLLRDKDFVDKLSQENPDYLKDLAGKIINKFNQIKDEILQKEGGEVNYYRIEMESSAYISLLSRIARNSDEVKNMVIEGFNLTGTQKEIFDEYGILVLNGWGEFNQEDYDSIKNVLSLLEETFGKEKVEKLINTIIRMPYNPSGILGAAYPNGVTWLFGDLHNYPTPGGEEKTIDIFEIVLFHELAHHIDFNLLTQKQHDLFNILNFESGYDPDNYARIYGMTNKWEDFATMVEAWGKDSIGLITKAKSNTDKTLLQKALFVGNLFTINGDVYLFKEVNGHIKIDKIITYAEFMEMLTGLRPM
jgi:hypothetical protein